MPSLTRLSPSTIVTSFRGTPSRRAIAVAAIGSVGETIAPSTKALGHVNPSIERVRDDRDADGGHDDEADREQPDRPYVGSQVAERGEEGGAVEERRQHAEEDELRLELDVRHSRDDADRQPAEHEQDRIRDAQSRGDREHRRDRAEQPERDDAILQIEVHGSSCRTCER